MTPLDTSAVPPIDEALLPARVRDGSAQDKKDYTAALGFEQMLVNELTKTMTASADPVGDGSNGDGGDSLADTGDSSENGSILGGTDAATSTYLQMLPEQLASSIMSNGGLGLAQSFYDAIRERR